MNQNWKDIIRTVAPNLAGLLGGPLAGTAVGALSQALLGMPDGNEEEIESVVSTASPEILARIKETEAKLKVDLANAGIRIEEIAAGDRDSARKRQIELKDNTPTYIAWTFIVGYLLIFLAFVLIDMNEVSQAKMAIMISLISVLSTGVVGILNYFFGSSSGSVAKNATIEKALNG